MSDKLTIISDKFRKGNTEVEVEGLTVVIDGTIKQVFDKIKVEKEYDNYTDILRDALMLGLNSIIKK